MNAAERKGIWLGLLGGRDLRRDAADDAAGRRQHEAPLMSGVVRRRSGRASVAALLSAVFLLLTRARPRRPTGGRWADLGWASVFGFRCCTSVAMRYVEAVHSA
jgi:hypothetical protein